MITHEGVDVFVEGYFQINSGEVKAEVPHQTMVKTRHLIVHTTSVSLPSLVNPGFKVKKTRPRQIGRQKRNE